MFWRQGCVRVSFFYYNKGGKKKSVPPLLPEALSLPQWLSFCCVVLVPASLSLFCWLGDTTLLPAALLTGECTSFVLIFILRLHVSPSTYPFHSGLSFPPIPLQLPLLLTLPVFPFTTHSCLASFLSSLLFFFSSHFSPSLVYSSVWELVFLLAVADCMHFLYNINSCNAIPACSNLCMVKLFIVFWHWQHEVKFGER